MNAAARVRVSESGPVPVAPPPHDLDAEGAVLSAIMLDASVLPRVHATGLRLEHFYADANARIFGAALDLEDQAVPIDPVTIATRLRVLDRLHQVGGAPYLAQLVDATPAVANVEAHAGAVIEAARRRRLRGLGHELLAASAGAEEATAVAAAMQAALLELQHAAPRLTSLEAVLPAALELAAARRLGEEKPVPVPWAGYAEGLAGGLWPGMHVLVAGTGFGKTTWTMQIGLGAAASGVPVAFVGLELDEEQIAIRLLAEDARVRWSALYTGRASERDLEQANEAAPRLAGLPVYVETGPPGGWPASRLVSLATSLRAKHPTGPILIVVDFLQLLGAEPSEGRVDLRERIGRAAYVARGVARDHGVAVVLVSSAARDKYSLLAGALKTAGIGSARVPGYLEPRRVLHNPDALVGLGKESGEIEFAADSVTVLARWPASLESGEKVYIVAVPKCRYSGASWSAMRFHWRFEELPARTVDDLPEADSGGRAGRPRVAVDDYEARVLAAVQAHAPVPSRNKIEVMVKGRASNVRDALAALLADGRVVKTDAGYELGSSTSSLDFEERTT